MAPPDKIIMGPRRGAEGSEGKRKGPREANPRSNPGPAQGTGRAHPFFLIQEDGQYIGQ